MAAEASATELKPRVEVGCVVCGRNAHLAVCSVAEIRRQLDYLQRFHRRRIRSRPSSEDLADRADFTQDYATDVVACSACGLVFRDPRPSAESIARAYARDRYGRERLEALFDSQLELFREKADALRELLPSGRIPVIVEIGSFVGGFLAAARERGWRAVGVDPGREVAEFCRAKRLTVHGTTATEAPIEHASADCVAIWNTFDQLPDPGPTLAAATRWLRPGGMLALRVPNGACFRGAIAALRRLPRALRPPLLAALAWNNLLAFPYLYGHSFETLDRLLARFGLRHLAIHPDTLTRLADRQTKAWAAWEERLLKTAWRGAARARPRLAPWFDAFFSTR